MSKEFTTVVTFAKKPLSGNEKYEKYIGELEEEVESLRAANASLGKRLSVEVANAKGDKEKFMCHLSQFLTTLYSSLGKTQNDILKQSVHLNEYLAKVSEERSEAMVKRMTEESQLIEYNKGE